MAPDPSKGEPKKCRVHGCYCIITSVEDDEWDPEYVCPLCTPEYILANGRFERAMDAWRVRSGGNGGMLRREGF